jgi:hypothetical protein
MPRVAFFAKHDAVSLISVLLVVIFIGYRGTNGHAELVSPYLTGDIRRPKLALQDGRVALWRLQPAKARKNVLTWGQYCRIQIP